MLWTICLRTYTGGPVQLQRVLDGLDRSARRLRSSPGASARSTLRTIFQEYRTVTGAEPVRVAVVGGGCAALTTAFELTRPEHEGRYEVTVYQMGWRLGGKGASGRGVADRIEEHGLHLWMGFYENAFRLMRDCYAERRAAFPDCRFADWQDAFKPAPDVGVADRTPNGTGSSGCAHFPPGHGLPGDPLDRRQSVHRARLSSPVGDADRRAAALRQRMRNRRTHRRAAASTRPRAGSHRCCRGYAAALRPARHDRRALRGERHPAAGDRRVASRSCSATASALPLRLDRRARRGRAAAARAARRRATASCAASGRSST